MSVDLALAAPAAPPVGAAAVHALRRARRANRVAETDWFELAYRAYLTGFAALFVILFLVGAIGDRVLDSAGIARVVDRGPAVVGLVAAVALAIGLRSGSRGGPLALEAAEVRHVLLAPVDRRRALLPLALTQVRHALFVGVTAGGTVGLVAAKRFGDGRIPWALAGAAAGVSAALAGHGAALVAGGTRLSRRVATAGGALVVVGAALDAARVIAWWPTRLVGQLALWPAKAAPVSLVAPAFAAALAGLGLACLGGVELESAERRTALAGQLRFAVTTRDLRTVVVLHRMLAQDHARSRPWFAVPGRRPVWRRAWRGILRTPVGRVLRIVVLVVGAGLALLGAYRGTTPLVVVSAVACFVAALDALETLAQDIDQSDRSESTPHERGWVHVHHLLPTVLFLVPVVALAIAVQAAVGARGRELAVVAIGIGLSALSGVGGAAVSLLMGAPDVTGRTLGADPGMMPPEVAGAVTLVRTVWPVVVAGLGVLPVVVALRTARGGADPLNGALPTVMFLVVVLAVVAGYVRFRDDLQQWWQQQRTEAMKNAGLANKPAGGTS